MRKAAMEPQEVVRRLSELLTIWKAPKGHIDGGLTIIERLIALRNREVETVAAALARVEYVERQNEELRRHLSALLADPDEARDAARRLLGYYR